MLPENYESFKTTLVELNSGKLEKMNCVSILLSFLIIIVSLLILHVTFWDTFGFQNLIFSFMAQQRHLAFLVEEQFFSAFFVFILRGINKGERNEAPKNLRARYIWYLDFYFLINKWMKPNRNPRGSHFTSITFRN